MTKQANMTRITSFLFSSSLLALFSSSDTDAFGSSSSSFVASPLARAKLINTQNVNAVAKSRTFSQPALLLHRDPLLLSASLASSRSTSTSTRLQVAQQKTTNDDSLNGSSNAYIYEDNIYYDDNGIAQGYWDEDGTYYLYEDDVDENGYAVDDDGSTGTANDSYYSNNGEQAPVYYDENNGYSYDTTTTNTKNGYSNGAGSDYYNDSGQQQQEMNGRSNGFNFKNINIDMDALSKTWNGITNGVSSHDYASTIRESWPGIPASIAISPNKRLIIGVLVMSIVLGLGLNFSDDLISNLETSMTQSFERSNNGNERVLESGSSSNSGQAQKMLNGARKDDVDQLRVIMEELGGDAKVLREEANIVVLKAVDQFVSQDGVASVVDKIESKGEAALQQLEKFFEGMGGKTSGFSTGTTGNGKQQVNGENMFSKEEVATIVKGVNAQGDKISGQVENFMQELGVMGDKEVNAILKQEKEKDKVAASAQFAQTPQGGGGGAVNNNVPKTPAAPAVKAPEAGSSVAPAAKAPVAVVPAVKAPEAVANAAPVVKAPEAVANVAPAVKAPEAVANAAPAVKAPEAVANAVPAVKAPEAVVNAAPAVKIPDAPPAVKAPEAVVNAAPIMPPPSTKAPESIATAANVNTVPGAPASAAVANKVPEAAVSPTVKAPENTAPQAPPAAIKAPEQVASNSAPEAPKVTAEKAPESSVIASKAPEAQTPPPIAKAPEAVAAVKIDTVVAPAAVAAPKAASTEATATTTTNIISEKAAAVSTASSESAPPATNTNSNNEQVAAKPVAVAQPVVAKVEVAPTPISDAASKPTAAETPTLVTRAPEAPRPAETTSAAKEATITPTPVAKQAETVLMSSAATDSSPVVAATDTTLTPSATNAPTAAVTEQTIDIDANSANRAAASAPADPSPLQTTTLTNWIEDVVTTTFVPPESQSSPRNDGMARTMETFSPGVRFAGTVDDVLFGVVPSYYDNAQTAATPAQFNEASAPASFSFVDVEQPTFGIMPEATTCHYEDALMADAATNPVVDNGYFEQVAYHDNDSSAPENDPYMEAQNDIPSITMAYSDDMAQQNSPAYYSMEEQEDAVEAALKFIQDATASASSSSGATELWPTTREEESAIHSADSARHSIEDAYLATTMSQDAAVTPEIDARTMQALVEAARQQPPATDYNIDNALQAMETARTAIDAIVPVPVLPSSIVDHYDHAEYYA
jgi:hypothetical protein